ASQRRNLRHRQRRAHAAVGGHPRGDAGAHQHPPPGLLRHPLRDPRGHHEAAQHRCQPLPAAPGHHHRVGRPGPALLHRRPHHGPPQRAGRHRRREEGGRRRGVQDRRHRGRLLQAQPQGGPRHRQRHVRGLRARGHRDVRRQRPGRPVGGPVRRLLRGHERQARVHGPPDPQAEAPPGVHRGRGHHGAHPGWQLLHEAGQEVERAGPAAEAQAGQVRAPHVAAVAGPPDRGHPRRHQVHRARGQLRERQPGHRRPPRQGAARRQLPGHPHRRVHGQRPPRHRQHRQAHVRAVLRARQRVLQQRAHLQPGRQPQPQPGLRLQGHRDRHGLLLLRAPVPGQPHHQPRAERGAAQPGRELPGPRLGQEDRRGDRHPEAHVVHLHRGAVPGRGPAPPRGEHQGVGEEHRDPGGQEGADHEPLGRALQRPLQREGADQRHRPRGRVHVRGGRGQRQPAADAEAARRAGGPRPQQRRRGAGALRVLQDHQVRGGAPRGAAPGGGGRPRGGRRGHRPRGEPDRGQPVVPAVPLRARGARLRVPDRREAQVPRRGVQQGVRRHQPGQARGPHARVPQGVGRQAAAHQRQVKNAKEKRREGRKYVEKKIKPVHVCPATGRRACHGGGQRFLRSYTVVVFKYILRTQFLL
ncbi:hypothetical protein ACJX0J_026011, partial [Zea mays]